jgi:hypothetical protein
VIKVETEVAIRQDRLKHLHGGTSSPSQPTPQLAPHGHSQLSGSTAAEVLNSLANENVLLVGRSIVNEVARSTSSGVVPPLHAASLTINRSTPLRGGHLHPA